MLNIQRFTCNMLQENCYVVYDETQECVIVDCGAFYPEEHTAIAQFIRDNHLTPVHLLATHGHFDHNLGNRQLFDAFGLKVELMTEDQALVEHLALQASSMMGLTLPDATAPVGHCFADGDTVSFGTHTFTILHTPGHTPGSCVFYCEAEHVAFTGDTLFKLSAGRTDLPGGSDNQMAESMKLLRKLPTDTTVYCGHGPQTTMGSELRSNPYLRDWRITW